MEGMRHDPGGLLDDSTEKMALIVLNASSPSESNAAFVCLWRKDGAANCLFYGMQEAIRSKYKPDIICGDFDSIEDGVKSYYSRLGVEILQISDQDSTDFMKCIQTVYDRNESLDIAAFCSFSGRVDQSFHSIHLLYWQNLHYPTKGRLYLFGPDSVTFLLRPGKNTIHLPADKFGPACGILPIGQPATISTQGLQWDVRDWRTSFGSQMSTSNILAADVVVVTSDEAVVFTVSLRMCISDSPCRSRAIHSGTIAARERRMQDPVARTAADDVGPQDALSSQTAAPMEQFPVTNDSTPAEEDVEKGVRFDPSVLPESDDAAEILKQVEFYLGDTNLRTDKFMRQEIEKEEGWVRINVISNFKRMRRFKPISAIVDALRGSPTLLEVNEKGNKVRRRVPIPKLADADDALLRTIYVQGFGKETKTLQLELEVFFSGMGQTNQTRLQRTDSGEFTGAVAVEFANKESVDKVISSDDQLIWGTFPLKIISREEFLALAPRPSPPSGGQTKKRGGPNRDNSSKPTQKKQKINRKGMGKEREREKKETSGKEKFEGKEDDKGSETADE